ncbi:hypothetical protein L6164_016591 [Bauhinia variegata]|uniref:Uncharacterized protein n=1 Tax=Bauhinia variegata TaxID=167791 RepID=A0ACB9NNW0_BAUVA|nr:hypothetical protein L6164_016591 [Bauhinia variegata]
MFLEIVRLCFAIFMAMSYSALWWYENHCLREQPIVREGLRGEVLQRLIDRNDVTCIDMLLMDIRSFHLLCALLHNEGKLKGDGLVSIEEQVAMFLHILAHNSKNRVVKFLFKRSGETVSRYCNLALNSVLRLQETLLRAPNPVPEDCLDERWKWFKSCLGALDGTHIEVNVPTIDKPRYLNRKGDVSTNVLGSHPNAKDYRNAQILLLEKLALAFGKDRAIEQERFAAADKILSIPHRLHMFWGSDDIDRLAFVKSLI